MSWGRKGFEAIDKSRRKSWGNESESLWQMIDELDAWQPMYGRSTGEEFDAI